MSTNRSEYQKKYMREYRAMMKESGICYDCGLFTHNGRTRCDKCMEKQAKAQKKRDDKKKALMGDAYRDAKAKYIKKWLSENPDKVNEYRKRASERNKMYG
jgi:hypothetical protein